IHRFATIDSTNNWVMDQARSGAPDGLVAVAAEQTAGRGRLGRKWIAPAGGSLLMSVLLRPTSLPADRLHLATAAVAMAGADALGLIAGVTPSLKWPNDLLISDKKVAGVLTEVDGPTENGSMAVVVGIGINCTWPDDLPPEISDIAIAANHAAGRPVHTEDVLDSLLEHLANRLDAGWNTIAREYNSRVATVGRDVRVELADESFTGMAAEVEHDGALIVITDAGPRRVLAGDVVHLRPASFACSPSSNPATRSLASGPAKPDPSA
ncbi:MAG: biotin--[acetyl-CoA-carboxylase] ligase, partial [Actinobacteria bacterium]|nr:biotin--[acetyl-CoA-carboxylase] ligase [Actinomycetota bacterium]